MVAVSLELKDSAERLIGETVEYKYLDFNAGRDAEFGQKTPIPINNNESCAFDVSIKEVVFANNEVWSSSENASWTNIPKQQPLSSKIADSELRKQFRLDVNPKAEYAYFAPLDLWCCCCGAINHKGEENCHLCNKPEKLSRNIDLTSLKKASNNRSAKIKAEQEAKDKAYQERKEKEVQQKELQKAQQKEQIKKVGAIAGIALALIASIVFLIIKVIMPLVQYNSAIELMNSGKYQEAKDIFLDIDGYKDSDKLATASSVGIIKDAAVGDIVAFGKYERNTEWIVLEKENSKVLLLSKYAIGEMPYNMECTDVTWESCILRDWLNNHYYTTAFNDNEQSRILPTTNEATNDKIFLLSEDEVEKYLPSDNAGRKASLSDRTSVWWWLRSPSKHSGSAEVVTSDGYVFSIGFDVDLEHGGVRPAMWIDISGL